jgi:hypothetical protein
MAAIASLTLGAFVCMAALEDSAHAGPAAAPLTIANGVTLSAGCAPNEASTNHVAFAAASTHQFLGYGVQLEANKAAKDIPHTIDTLKQLGFKWVKVALARADKSETDVANADAAQEYPAQLAHPDADVPPKNKNLFTALHNAGIIVVDTIHHPPAAFFDATAVQKGRHGRRIKPESIPQLAQYFANYLRSMLAAGIRPDYIELLNEPNIRQGGEYTSEEYATLIKDVEQDLGTSTGVNLSGPGTASNVGVGLDFIQAAQSAGALSRLKAIALHTYYVRDNPVNNGIPPADDPAFHSIATIAAKMGVPMISTEYGGTDIKTKLTDPGKESVDTAEEMKASLDLIRQGESAAIVWALHPNHKSGQQTNTWALIDANGPTNAYWVFDVLARQIPPGSDVLAVDHSDIIPTMYSLGYAAFRKDSTVYVGLANPGQSQMSVAVDLSRLGSHSTVHVSAPLKDRVVEADMRVAGNTCPANVTLPAGTGVLLRIAVQK